MIITNRNLEKVITDGVKKGVEESIKERVLSLGWNKLIQIDDLIRRLGGYKETDEGIDKMKLILSDGQKIHFISEKQRKKMLNGETLHLILSDGDEFEIKMKTKRTIALLHEAYPLNITKNSLYFCGIKSDLWEKAFESYVELEENPTVEEFMKRHGFTRKTDIEDIIGYSRYYNGYDGYVKYYL